MILLTGGGTGGHLSAIRELRDACLESGVQSFYVGSQYGQERHWFREAGTEAQAVGFSASYFLPVRSLVDRKRPAQLLSLLMLGMATLRAMFILRRHHVRAVISVGAYSAAPASIAAVILRIPLYINEHNASLSGLHAYLAPHAAAIFCSFIPDSPVRDYPVPKGFFESRRCRDKPRTVLFLGGSQGARFINELALTLAPELSRRGIAIIHQTGRVEYEKVALAYRALNIENLDLFDFDPQISRRFGLADLAVCRSGAGTVWELAANGLPALLIPYPYAARDHQYQNARYFESQGLVWLQRQEDVDPGDVLALLEQNLAHRSESLMKLVTPGGAKAMIQYVRNETSGRH